MKTNMEYIITALIVFTIILYLINLALYLRAWFIHKPNAIYLHNNPKVTIIVPAYNEEVGIIYSLTSMLKQTYKNCNIIVVNDGSSDDTMKKIVNHFNMRERAIKPIKELHNYKPVKRTFVGGGIILIDKANGGKSDALNAGFAYTNSEYILSVDGDTLLSRNCIETILKHKDPEADAVATMIGISNDNEVVEGEIKNPIVPKNFWARVQWLEYYRGYSLLRDSTIDHNCVTVISGACSLIKSEMIAMTGGYKHNHLGEDMEHTLHIHKLGGRVQYLNKIVSWTEVPNNISDLGKQRVRWFRGGFESYIDYTNLLFSSKNKFFGWLILPYIWFSSIFIPWITLIGGIVGVVGIVVYKIHPNYWLWFTMVILYYTNTIIAFYYLKYRLHLYKKISGLFWIMLIEGFSVHFLMTFWVIKAHLLEFFGGKRNWNSIKRKGFMGE